jgi:predicted RNA binding protein YcfA (HicA-like mRNA interferase family)
MIGRHYPLTCKEVKRILKNLGFKPRPKKGTSHEQWVREDPPPFRKVTVDCPKSPFSKILISSMAKQAGVSKKEFYKHNK